MARNEARWATIWCIVAGIVLALDRAGKFFALDVWYQRPVRILPGVELTFLLNRGLAFSVPSSPVVQGMILLALVVLLAVCIRAFRRHNVRTAVGTLLMLAGAASNIADRVLYGGVVDYLRIVLPSVFNLADVVIVLGCIVLLAPGRERVEERMADPTTVQE